MGAEICGDKLLLGRSGTRKVKLSAGKFTLYNDFIKMIASVAEA